MRWARVEQNEVVEITNDNPAGRYHPDIEWHEVLDEVDVGWTFDEHQGFEPPSPMSSLVAAQMKGIQLWNEFSLRMQLPILYDGDNFLIDDWSIKTIETTLMACIALGLTDVDPVPVQAPLQPGYWLAADTDGVARVPVQMSYGRFKGLVLAAYIRNAALWGKLVIHRATIEAMVAEGVTAEQITTYDHKTGWED